MSVSLFSHPCHCELLSKVFCISRQTSNWPGLIISFTIDLKMKSEMVCYTKYIQKLMLFFKPRAIKLYDTDFGFSIWKDIFKTQLFMKDRLSLERTFEIKVQFSFLFTQSFDTATKKSKNFTLLNFGMTYWCVFFLHAQHILRFQQNFKHAKIWGLWAKWYSALNFWFYFHI